MRKRIGVSSSLDKSAANSSVAALEDPASALKPTSQIAASSIRTARTNPRYKALVKAHVIQPEVEAGHRHASSTHIEKLSKLRTLEWISRVKDGWLKSEAGQAWLNDEIRSGHIFNFDSTDDAEISNIWRARMRRWLDRVSRMLLRTAPDKATSKRWESIIGRQLSADRDPVEGSEKKQALAILKQWSHLFALSANINSDGLMSAVVIRPSPPNGFVVVGGERRYWACRLASMDRIPSTGGAVEDVKAFSRTIHENLDRLDIDFSGQVASMRQYVSMKLGEECGPDNKSIKISFFENEFSGRSRSWNHRWRVLCLLPEGCDVLQQIYADELTDVKVVDEMARDLLRQHKANIGAPPRDDTDQSAGNPENKATPKTSPPATTQRKASQKPAAPTTRAKVRVPGTEAGIRILSALKSTEGITEEASKSIESALGGWRGAPDVQRRKYLEEVIDAMAKNLDHLDEIEN